MTLNLRLTLIAGLMWGVVALVVGLAANLIGGLAPSIEGLTLGTYAVMFAGIHFVARNKGKFAEDLIGGIVAGIIAALFLLLLEMIGVNIAVEAGGLANVLIQGVLAGAAGALGMVLIKHVKS
ncbi:MAG: hypothetical protein JXB07_05175 [Anaerolineae bacterium]|nr:hypothetical protein [Anaerolineae bacterium]